MLELEITKLGAGGDGIGYHDAIPYYVPFTLPGDTVLVDVGDKRGKGFVADLQKILSPSEHRNKPECRHFGTCGGCNLQHFKAGKLADWKRGLIEETLSHADIDDVAINPTITSPAHSRRRAQFVAAKRKKGVMIGYHLRRSHQIFDVGDCPLIDPQILKLVKPLRQMLLHIMPRNSRARLTITATENGADLLITASHSIDLEAREQLAQFAQANDICRISWLDESESLLEQVAELKPAEISIGRDRTVLAPGGFLQATQQGQETLIRMTMEQITDGASVLDLFAGGGSFAIPAAHKAKNVLAVENDEELVFSLQNAANKAMLPIKTETRDLFRRPLVSVELNKFDTVIIDPPRAGAAAQVAEITQSNIQKIIFISCNPASYARDIKELIEAGYHLTEITPLDQFRWSEHVELFSVLTKDPV